MLTNYEESAPLEFSTDLLIPVKVNPVLDTPLH